MIKDFPFSIRNWVPKISPQVGIIYYHLEEIKSKILRVTTYNILADSLIEHTTNKNESDKKLFLNWEFRRSLIINELKTLNSDIICIQEFEKDSLFIQEMGKNGYDVCFKPRTGGNHSEGNALFWKFDKFDLENLYCLEFNILNESSIYNKDNISIIAVLRQRNSKNMFIVATSHLLFNINRGDIKLAQTFQTLSALHLLREKYQLENNVNLIFTGDFNAIPNSGIYKFITEGKLNCSNLDYKKISGQINGQLQNYDLINNKRFFKSSLLRSICSKYDEETKFLTSFQENNWVNELLSVEPILGVEDIISLVSLDKSKMKIQENKSKVITNPIRMKSAYSENLKNILDIITDNFSNNIIKSLISKEDLNDIDVYGIKISIDRMDNTLNFLKDLTLEPPMTYFAKNSMINVDFIFFCGNMEVLRTLNTPDIYSILEMKGLPNKIYPSDHISLTAEFICNQ